MRAVGRRLQRVGDTQALAGHLRHPAAVEHHPRHLAGDVHRGDELAGGAVEGEGGQPVAVARHDVGDVGGVAVEHQRLDALEHPPVAAALGGRGDAVERVAAAALLDGDRRPPSAVGEVGQDGAVVGTRRDERTGHR